MMARSSPAPPKWCHVYVNGRWLKSAKLTPDQWLDSMQDVEADDIVFNETPTAVWFDIRAKGERHALTYNPS